MKLRESELGPEVYIRRRGRGSSHSRDFSPSALDSSSATAGGVLPLSHNHLVSWTAVFHSPVTEIGEAKLIDLGLHLYHSQQSTMRFILPTTRCDSPHPLEHDHPSHTPTAPSINDLENSTDDDTTKQHFVREAKRHLERMQAPAYQVRQGETPEERLTRWFGEGGDAGTYRGFPSWPVVSFTRA